MTARRTIKVLGAPIPLPTLDAEVARLRREIRRRSAVVVTGRVAVAPVRRVSLRRSIQKLGARVPVVEIVEIEGDRVEEIERLEHLEAVLACYDRVAAHLAQSREAHKRFFQSVASQVRLGALDALGRIERAERQRLSLVEDAEALGDPGLLARAASQKGRLRGAARAVAQSALLILRKLSLYDDGLAALAREGAVQGEILERLRARLAIQRKMLALDQEIDALEDAVGQMTAMALDFEDAMRDCLGPLQVLLDEVWAVDDRLGAAALEIESLTEGMLQDVAPGSGGDGAFVDLLVSAKVGHDDLALMWGQIEGVGPDGDAFELAVAGEAPTLRAALDNIEGLLHLKIGPWLARGLPERRAIEMPPAPPRPTPAPRLAPHLDGGPPVRELGGAMLAGLDLRRVCFEGVVLSGATLSGANLSGANLDGADLSGADLSGADLSGAWLRGADLSGARLDGAMWFGARFDRATRWPEGVAWSTLGAFGPGAVLRDVNLREVSLRGADLSGADFQRARLVGADLRGADLSGADLRGVDLSRADLRGTDMRGARLQERGMSGVVGVGAVFEGARWDRSTQWPEGVRIKRSDGS